MVVADKLDFIIKQNENNKLSHAFLIETNDIDKCFNDVKKLCKIINCNSKYNENCNMCSICKLIDMGNLPSLVVIEPDGVNIKKSQLLTLETKFSVKPVYSKYNIYIVKHAEKMNSSASNSILKFLEEPEDGIIGFFITNSIDNMLQTITSRCEKIHIDYLDNDKINELTNIDREIIDNLFIKDYNYIKQLIIDNYVDRSQLETFLLKIYNNYHNDFINNYMNNNILKKLDIIRNVIDFNRNNVNIDLLLDYLLIEMRRSND